ncbi:MAG: 23S rRNA (guanosine(2251)-2'-O)-methyltransferase RlmB [Bacteroidota bacterium]
MMKNNEMIYGFQSVMEALNSDKQVDKILLRKGSQGQAFVELHKLAREKNVPCSFVPLEKINGLIRGNHQGVLAFISPIAYQEIESIVPFLFENGKTPLLIILDGVTDVRNLGAVARSAECAGADALIIPALGSARVSADAVKTSAGALMNLPVCRTFNLPATLEFLKQSGIHITAASEKSKIPYYKSDFNVPLAIILGAEDTGVSKECLDKTDSQISIPMKGATASLNVSVAAGILLFEVLRQRDQFPQK